MKCIFNSGLRLVPCKYEFENFGYSDEGMITSSLKWKHFQKDFVISNLLLDLQEVLTMLKSTVNEFVIFFLSFFGVA